MNRIFLACLALLLSATAASANCSGRDLWPVYSPEFRGSLEKSVSRNVYSDGRFFRVEKNGKTSYLFGTMHSAATGKLRLPNAVTKEIRASKRLLVEVAEPESKGFFKDLDRHFGLFFTPEPNSFFKRFSPEDWKFISAVAKARGFPRGAIYHARPWYVYEMINSLGCGRRPGETEIMDAKIEKIARRSGVEVISLETPMQVIRAMDGFSEKDFATMTQAELFGLGQTRPGDLAKTRLNMYLRADIQMIWQLQLTQYAGFSDKRAAGLLTRLWEDRMLGQRNRDWMPAIYKAAAEGDAFIAVGALHLGGKHGIVRSLAKRGYKVTRLKFVFR